MAIAACASAALAFAAGCSRAPAPAASNETPAATSPASSESPAPVALPDLSSVAGPVQQQIRARYDALGQAIGDSRVPGAERARRYGDLGHVLMAATFFEEAILCYRHAEALQPDEARWPYFRAHASLRKGDQGAAAQAFERALSLQPTYVPAMVWLGDTYMDLGRTEAAQATFANALAQQPDSAAAQFGAGRAALARRAYAEAVRHMEQALRIAPQASAVHYPLAMAYRGTGERGKAEALLQKRGTAAPDLPDPLMQQAEVMLDSAVSYEGLGMQALRRQDWTGAKQAFERGLEVAPQDASLRYWMATAMIASGDAAGAEREFRALLRAQPDFAKAHFSLGAILDQRGQKNDALREYEAAVRDAPNMPEARLRLADTLRAMGRMQPAFDQYTETVRLDPSVADAWVGGAQALIALGQREQARDWLARGRHVHPNRRELAELEARVR
jgi:tetratricopeptide (TPR) repeat protein